MPCLLLQQGENAGALGHHVVALMSTLARLVGRGGLLGFWRRLDDDRGRRRGLWGRAGGAAQQQQAEQSRNGQNRAHRGDQRTGTSIRDQAFLTGRGGSRRSIARPPCLRSVDAYRRSANKGPITHARHEREGERTVKKWILILAALGMVACNSDDKKGDDDGAKGEEKKEAKASKTLLEGKADGKDVKLEHAIVASRGTSALWIHASTKELSCDDMNPGSIKGKDGVQVAIQLTPKLQPDGKTVWKIESGNFAAGDVTGRKVGKEAKVTIDGSADKAVNGELDFTIEDNDGKKLELKGKVGAKGCGLKPLSGKEPEARPQKGLKVSISGHTFDIVGAKLTKEKDADVLELSTAPRDCEKAFYSSGDFAINLKLKGSPPQVVHSWFRGDMMESNYNDNHAGMGTFEIGPDKDGKVSVKADYQKKSFDFDVVVKGDVEAFRCEEKK